MKYFSRILTILMLSAVCYAQNQTPKFRLPTSVVPVRYSVELTVIPDKDTFNGTVDIDLNYKVESSVLWLNAEKLTVKSATLSLGGKTISAKITSEPKDLVGFSFDSTIPPGPAKFHAEYEGQISRKDMQGIFQVKDGDHWYIYSQFENIAARQAFPCFDEPSFKVPWQLTLHVPKDDGAFSNTPILSERNSSDGMKTVQFAETKPLPSYLVALAVGPMDIIPAGHAGTNNTEIRIITPKGHIPDAKYTAADTPDIVNLLEKYFGIPYPYEKLDEVAIPMAGYAMEHPGLVTYGSGIILAKPEEMTLQWKTLSTSVIAHELAHQWFGDLVTTSWWDDIWLNEGFASWMANKIVNQYHPEWKMGLTELNGHQDAMTTDALVSSRKVRQPILSDDDIANAFDDITYNKGSALLNMFESYIGPEKFQERIRQYLHKYAWANATSAQFLESLGGSDQAIARAFSTFLDQPGVPLVTVRLQCGTGKYKIDLSQERFLPRGSQGSSKQTWNIPVCFRYPAGSESHRSCALMAETTAVVDLPGATGCPTWVDANADAAGYYRVLYQGGILNSLSQSEKNLSSPERVSLVGDIAALTQGYLPLGEAMGLVPNFVSDPNRDVVTKTLDIVGNLDDHLIPTELKPNYRRYMSSLYKQRAQQLGWKAKQGENDDDRQLRPKLFSVLADQAEDPEFIEQGKKLALAWLDDHQAVDPDMVDVVLKSAARHGDQSLFERLRGQVKKETNELLRYNLFSAMGSFRDPAIAKAACAMILTDEFDNRESIAILFAARSSPQTRDIAYAFVKQNWDVLVDKLPTDSGAFLPFIARHYCDAQHLSDAEAFFKDRSTKYAGGPRNLSQVLEGISLCAANREANQSSVAAFLKKF
jgi:cytosol alanyl aminopeptidase